MLHRSGYRVTSYASAQQFLADALESGLVDELIDDAAARDFDVSDAYIHPNGFWKVRLHGRSLGSTQVRLHYWPDGSGTGDVHDHGWPYASLALRGRGIEDVYVESRGMAATAFSYHPSRPGQFSLGWVSRPTQIEVDSTQLILPGQLSGGEASHIHTFTAASGSDLLTLVATGEPAVDFSRVFIPGEVSRMQILEPTALSRAQIEIMIEDARSARTVLQSGS